MRGGVVLVRLFESVYDALQLGVVVAEGLSDVLQVGFALGGGGFGDDAPGLPVPFVGVDSGRFVPRARNGVGLSQNKEKICNQKIRMGFAGYIITRTIE